MRLLAVFLRYGRTDGVESQLPIATYKDVGARMRLSSSTIRVLVNDHLRLIQNGKDPVCNRTDREIKLEAQKLKMEINTFANEIICSSDKLE